MELNFQGKRALVTGAGKGLGRGIALKLAECGAQVVAISRTQSDLDSLKEQLAECGAQVVAISRTQSDLNSLKEQFPSIESYIVDVTDWDAARKVVESIGHVDLLVNNAGTSMQEHFVDVPKESLISLFDLNFMAVYNVSQVIAKRMIEQGNGGAIVMMSSILSSIASHGRSVYCCTKAALDQLTRCLALELGPHKIRVNSVNPTVVLTPMTLAHGWDNPEKAAKITSRTPLGRIAEVDDVVNTTLFLLSDKASMINGAILPVDGGLATHI